MKNISSILIHCQYVYGIGHLVRATELALGLSTKFNIYLINGGEKVPNFEISDSINYIQLPAIYKKETDTFLTPVNSSLDISECFQLREEIITEIIETVEPDIIITEHFPFGLLFEKEVLRLITKAKEVNVNVRVLSSVRDIIESSKGGERDKYICELLNKWYDMVLVHGDSNIIPLESSFPMIKDITIPIHTTGYIVRHIEQSIKSIPPVLLVSVGGGRVGGELIDAVIEAHQKILQQWNHQLVIFTGAFQKKLSELYIVNNVKASSNILIHGFDKKIYLQTLSKATAVICLGGYNSLIEAIATERSVLVYKRKFHGKNREQDLRSTYFSKLGFIKTIDMADFHHDVLANIVLDTVFNYKSKEQKININGVQKSIDIISSLINQN